MTESETPPPGSHLQGDSQSLRDVLWAIRQSVKNARGAVESNQVVDKDVRGTLTGVIAKIDGALDLLHAPPPVQHVATIVDMLRLRADTMNGAHKVGAGDGNTYVPETYGPSDAKLDRQAADLLASMPTPGSHVTDRNLIAAAVRMALESAAQTAYRVCAETRHVTLGDKARNAIRALADDLPPQSREGGTPTGQDRE